MNTSSLALLTPTSRGRRYDGPVSMARPTCRKPKLIFASADAIAADVTLASAEAKISFGFRQVGLAIDTGTSYLLPREVGVSKAKELVFTGELLDAEEAGDLGLFNHVYPEDFEAEADAFVKQIATGPTVALRTSKKLVDQGTNQSLRDAQDNEAAAQAAVFETHDHEEGATAFMEGRDPEFEGR